MNPSEINVWQVRNELSLLIEKYPDRTGKALDDFDGGYDSEGVCVYYTDAHGKPITMANHDDDTEEYRLVTPICVVAEWIESFHPEFKGNDLIRKILLRNRTLKNTTYNESPFAVTVLDLLAKAQDAQDEENARWSDIADVM